MNLSRTGKIEVRKTRESRSQDEAAIVMNDAGKTLLRAR